VCSDEMAKWLWPVPPMKPRTSEVDKVLADILRECEEVSHA
jgi:hypothetical protein